jgi:hypothetical protein
MSGAKRMNLPPLPDVVTSTPAEKTILEDGVAAEDEAKKQSEGEKAMPSSAPNEKKPRHPFKDFWMKIRQKIKRKGDKDHE